MTGDRIALFDEEINCQDFTASAIRKLMSTENYWNGSDRGKPSMGVEH